MLCKRRSALVFYIQWYRGCSVSAKAFMAKQALRRQRGGLQKTNLRRWRRKRVGATEKLLSYSQEEENQSLDVQGLEAVLTGLLQGR